MARRFVLFLLELYTYWLNFFKTFNSFKHRLKATIFNGKYSYIAIHTVNQNLLKIVDFEDASLAYIMFLYLAQKLHVFSQNTFVRIHDDILKQYLEYPSVAHIVTTHYENGVQKDAIMTLAAKNDIHHQAKSNMGIEFAALLSNTDVTDIVKIYKESLVDVNITVQEFVNVLQARHYLQPTCDITIPTLTIIDLCTMEEQVFKANDVIKI